MMLFGLILALLMGFLLGLLGGGGTIITVPILHYVLGFEAKAAIAMSLGISCVVSLFGAMSHWRQGNVRGRVALVFSAVAMGATYGGAKLSQLMSNEAQLLIFSVVMLTAASLMLRGRRKPGPGTPTVLQPRLGAIALIAILVGLMSGVVGVGGGFMIVPALVLLAGMDMRRAVGTSLLILTMNSAAGFSGYLGQVEIQWTFMALFAAIATIGILLGARLVNAIPQQRLRTGFAVFLFLMGFWILIRTALDILQATA